MIDSATSYPIPVGNPTSTLSVNSNFYYTIQTLNFPALLPSSCSINLGQNYSIDLIIPFPSPPLYLPNEQIEISTPFGLITFQPPSNTLVQQYIELILKVLSSGYFVSTGSTHDGRTGKCGTENKSARPALPREKDDRPIERVLDLKSIYLTNSLALNSIPQTGIPIFHEGVLFLDIHRGYSMPDFRSSSTIIIGNRAREDRAELEIEASKRDKKWRDYHEWILHHELFHFMEYSVSCSLHSIQSSLSSDNSSELSHSQSGPTSVPNHLYYPDESESALHFSTQLSKAWAHPQFQPLSYSDTNSNHENHTISNIAEAGQIYQNIHEKFKADWSLLTAPISVDCVSSSLSSSSECTSTDIPKGYITSYAATSVDEDMAETYAYLMFSKSQEATKRSQWKLNENEIQVDGIVQRKVKMLKNWCIWAGYSRIIQSYTS
ncbi:hypothetical protein BKA69DRAFT_91555 [Paraphysoderma sedebokerense]|nr:hypothetical protein BKA69DRAFT_91555 [Paraphysoderma sedebokerense]